MKCVYVNRFLYLIMDNTYGFLVTSLDNIATETLAKCEEKFPIITKHPAEVIRIVLYIHLLFI